MRPSVHIVPVQQPHSNHIGKADACNLQWLLERIQALTCFNAMRRHLQHAQTCVYHTIEPNGPLLVAGVRTLVALYDLIPWYYPSATFPPCCLDLRAGYARYLHQLQRSDHFSAILEATKRDAVERLRITLLVPSEDRVLADLKSSCPHRFASRRVHMIGVVPGDDLPALYSRKQSTVIQGLAATLPVCSMR